MQFVLRELSHPTAALDRIYDGVFEPTHRRLCQIWEQATGEPAESERTRITVFTLIGQVIYFRIGREAVMRRMGWDDIGAAEAGGGDAVVKDNLEAILAAREGVKTMSFLCSMPLAARCFRPARPRRRSPSAMSRANMCCWRRSRWRRSRRYGQARRPRQAGHDVVSWKTPMPASPWRRPKRRWRRREAQLADLQVGRRPEEIAVLEAMVGIGECAGRGSRRVLARATDLFKRGIAPQAESMRPRPPSSCAEAQVGQAEANLAVGKLPARPRR